MTCRLLSLSTVQAERERLSRELYALSFRRPSQTVTGEMRRLSARLERLDRTIAQAPRRVVVRLRPAAPQVAR
jgi:hypothetical protein